MSLLARRISEEQALPLVAVLFSLFTAVVSSPKAEPSGRELLLFTINGAEIRGIEQVAALKPEYRTPEGLVELDREFHGDGLDEVLFTTPDSALWLALGKHIHLYTQTVDRVQSASYGDAFARVIIIDDENRESDLRPTLGRGMAIALVAIALTGLASGVFMGLLRRRSLSGLGRDPLVDRAFYGLIVGVLAALIFYGLSNRKLDFRGLLTRSSDRHLHEYMISPLRK